MNRQLKVAGLLAFTSIRRGNFGVILLTMFILVLVSLNLLFVPGLLDGLVWSANDKLVSTYTGDLLVESSSASPTMENAGQLVAQITRIKGVQSATPRSTLTAQIEFETRHINAAINGVEPDTEKTVFSISDYIVEGSYLSADDTDVILLGIELAGADKPNIELYARSLQNVHAGDKISVTFNNGVQKTYTVKGIFYSEFIQTDLQAFIPQKELEAVAPLLTDRASTIYIKTTSGADTAEITNQITSIREDIRVMTWEAYAGIVRSMTDSFHIINTILNVVNLLVAGVTVFIITYVDIANRRRQIGIQRAIGITPVSITLSYILRALFYAIIALTLAIIVFIYGVIPLEAQYPFHFPFGSVYLRIVPAFMVHTAWMILSVAVVAAFVPVYTVMRTKIIDAIWG